MKRTATLLTILFVLCASYGFGGGPSFIGVIINDSAGNGDTKVVWSADKIYDQLALKQDTLTVLKDLVTSSPLSGGVNDILIGSDSDVTLSIADAAADGATKGAAAFATNDFEATTGVISIDYTNGTAAATGVKGFLTGTDWDTFNGKISAASSDELTNKGYDANGTGNTLKMYGYLAFANPQMAGSGLTAGMDTTNTNEYYGQVTFADDVDEATNYIEYRTEVPRDIDTSVDIVAWFKFRLGGADTADHDYVISMESVADSGDYTGTPANAINLSYTADGSGADGDVETAGGDTLTDWKSNVTAGQLWVIRVARDGDDGTNDASTTDSYSGQLTIRYGVSQ